MDTSELTITEIHQSLVKKKFSAQELVKQFLKRIDSYNPALNAILTGNQEQVTQTAAEIDQKIAFGETIGLLSGIPYTAKDVFVTKGIKTTAGSAVLADYIPVYNATVIEKLKSHGAILIGKTNCDAWGHGGSTENSDFKPTRNPWDTDCVPGGSSGGSGASVAAGFDMFSIGEDTGGSIRSPANFCGVTGLKVTYGRVSRYGAIAFASSLDTVGPMARSVEDCAAVLTAIAGKDPLDATTVPAQVPNYFAEIKNPPKTLKIGLPKEYLGKGLDSEVKSAILDAVKKLEQRGHSVVEVSLPATEAAINTYYIISPSETSSNLARYDGIRYGSGRDAFGAEAKRRIMIGTYSLSSGYYDAYYNKAMQIRTLVKQDFEKTFSSVDVILAPVAPTPAFKIGEKVNDPLAMYLEDVYTVPINLAGVPSLSLPCGFSESGLPIGMQLIGSQFSESLLLQVGYHYQQMTDWHKERPKGFV